MLRKYNQLIEHTEEYIACEANAAMLNEASDYLTQQVQLYVQNMEVKYMDRYFEEVHVNRRRETALEILKEHNRNEAVYADLEAALQSSNDLMEREIYAMKLISVANDYEEAALPEEVRVISLKKDDVELAPEEMIEKARTMVFDTGYQDAKALIRSHLDHFLDNVLEVMAKEQESSVSVLGKSLFEQHIYISILFVMNILTFVFITILIVRPLSIHIKHIKENDSLQIIGSYEFKYLALTYNDIYDLNATNQAMLARNAERDPLTGIRNRRAFDELRELMKNSRTPMALLLIDVDRFKQINDQYGHETGDLILKKVAEFLKIAFQSVGYPVRFGGDEFAVILTDVRMGDMDRLGDKISEMNARLQNPEDRLPPVSLSVGVAFSKNGFCEELFSQADQALYMVKKNGRCGCSVYQTQE